MNTILNDFTTSALVEAIEASLFAFYRNMACCKRIEVYDGSDILWTISESHSWPLFNSIMRARLDEERVGPTIEAVISRARSKKVNLLWWTGPSTKPADLGSRLEADGFVHLADATGMAVDLHKLPERLPPVSDLTIRRVQDIEDLKIWSHVCSAGFGMPEGSEEIWRDRYASMGLGVDKPMRHYIGWWKGEPVSVSSVLLAAGVAGLNNVATVPPARRHGIGAAVSLLPFEDARSLGFRVGVLQAGPMAVGVYRRLGFQKYCELPVYKWSEKK